MKSARPRAVVVDDVELNVRAHKEARASLKYFPYSQQGRSTAE